MTARARARDHIEQALGELDVATTRDPGINERGVVLLEKAIEGLQIAAFMINQVDAPENTTGRKVRAAV